MINQTWLNNGAKRVALIFSLILTFPAFALASDGPCSNYAKHGAIKAYKAEFGTVQGSDGIQYSASLVEADGNIFDYLVSISDNNEDGETWTIDYDVRVKKEGTRCKVVKVRKQDDNE